MACVLDTAGDVDIAAAEITRNLLPNDVVYQAFSPENLAKQEDSIEVGIPFWLWGYPLGISGQLISLPAACWLSLRPRNGLRFHGYSDRCAPTEEPAARRLSLQ